MRPPDGPRHSIPTRRSRNVADEEKDRLEERIERLEAEIDDAQETIAELEASNRERQESVSQLRTFSDGVHERVRSAGADVRESVVKITESDSTPLEVTFPGWVSDDGVISTIAAVEERLNQPAIELYDGTVRSDVTVSVPEDTTEPLAILETSTDGIDPLSVETSDELSEGDPLFSVHHDVGDWMISLGTCLTVTDDERFEADVRAEAGAPVFDADGTVVGIGTSSMPESLDPAEWPLSGSNEIHEQFPDPFVLTALSSEDISTAVASVATASTTNASSEGTDV